MSPAPGWNQRGFTLAEAMIVIVLSGVVTIGLIGFYLNSQATWIDGSSQALTQREGTLLVETMAEKTRAASSFEINQVSGGPNGVVYLFDSALQPLGSFEWRDSLVYYRRPDDSEAPVTTSIVEEFRLADDVNPGRVLHLTNLRLRSTDGKQVNMTSMFALQNVAAP